MPLMRVSASWERMPPQSLALMRNQVRSEPSPIRAEDCLLESRHASARRRYASQAVGVYSSRTFSELRSGIRRSPALGAGTGSAMGMTSSPWGRRYCQLAGGASNTANWQNLVKILQQNQYLDSGLRRAFLGAE